MNVRTGDALKQARALFERAVAEDPHYALAYAGLADCCSLTAVSFRGRRRRRPHRSGARRGAQGARARRRPGRRPRLARVHQVPLRLGLGAAPKRGVPARASISIPATRRHASGTRCSWRRAAGSTRRSREMNTALQLDPLSLVIQAGIGRILHFAGRQRRVDPPVPSTSCDTNPAFGQARIDLALDAHGARRDRRGARRARTRRGGAGARLDDRAAPGVLRRARRPRGRCASARSTTCGPRYDRGDAGADDVAMLAAVLGDWHVGSDVARRGLHAARAVSRLRRRRAGDGSAPRRSRVPRAAPPPRVQRVDGRRISPRTIGTPRTRHGCTIARERRFR